MPRLVLAGIRELPCFIFDEAGIEAGIRELYAAFSWNRGHRGCFWVGQAPNPSILRIVRRMGMCAVCTNRMELALAERSGFAGTELFYAPAVAVPDAEALAARLGALPVLDSPNQIMLTERFRTLPPVVGLRYNPDRHPLYGRRTLRKAEDLALGMNRAELTRAISILKSKGIRRIGLHADFTDQGNVAVLLVAYKMLLELAAELRGTIEVAYCALSGAMGEFANDGEQASEMPQLGQEMESRCRQVCQAYGMEQIPLYTQLSEDVVSKNSIFAARVCAIKERTHRFLGVDASMDHFRHGPGGKGRARAALIQRASGGISKFYHVYSNNPNSANRLADHQLMPNAEIGDIAVIQGVQPGALPCTEYLFTKEGNLRKIRRAPGEGDWFATLDCNPDCAQPL